MAIRSPEAGLTPQAAAQVAAPVFAEAELVIECRKLYWQDLDPAHFLDPRSTRTTRARITTACITAKSWRCAARPPTWPDKEVRRCRILLLDDTLRVSVYFDRSVAALRQHLPLPGGNLPTGEKLLRESEAGLRLTPGRRARWPPTC